MLLHEAWAKQWSQQRALSPSTLGETDSVEHIQAPCVIRCQVSHITHFQGLWFASLLCAGFVLLAFMGGDKTQFPNKSHTEVYS